MEKVTEQVTKINNKLKSTPIGFFDSGVGGLSVYSEFKDILPNENTIYFGDLKNMPYGNKSKKELLTFAKNILNFYAKKKVKAVVIACNTSSATIYEDIKNEYDFKIYPIIQSCAKVISQTNMESVGVFATIATIKSGAYHYELQNYNKNLSVYEISCPNWTNYVEHNLITSKECIADIKDKTEKMLSYKPDKIILGCTHYPYLLGILSEFAPENMFINPAKIFVEYIKDDLQKYNLLNNSTINGTEEFYVSANPDKFVDNAKMFYKVKKQPIIVL